MENPQLLIFQFAQSGKQLDDFIELVSEIPLSPFYFEPAASLKKRRIIIPLRFGRIYVEEEFRFFLIGYSGYTTHWISEFTNNLPLSSLSGYILIVDAQYIECILMAKNLETLSPYICDDLEKQYGDTG